MNYQIIEHYAGSDVVRVQDQVLPACGLVEDEDGIRLLVITHPPVPQVVWVQALAEGAAGILWVNDQSPPLPFPEVCAFILTDDFMTVRQEQDRFFVVPSNAWRFSEVLLTYRQMLTAPKVTKKPGSTSFVHLHAHSEFSPLDGLSKVDEMVDAVVADGQPALAVTDHGVCAAHPHLQIASTKAGIQPIFGIEAYFINDRIERPPEKPKLDKDMPVEERKVILEAWQAEVNRIKDYYHLILWAENDIGLRNLWAASTQAQGDGFYYKPRMDWATLERFSEGLLCSTACMRGPVARPLLADDLDLAMSNLHRLQAIFPDRLYLELHTCLTPEQIKINYGLAEIHQVSGIPIIGVVDSHYPCASDKEHHKVWLAAQTNQDVADDTTLFENDEADYHVMTAEEVYDCLVRSVDPALAQHCMDTTVDVAERCTAKIAGKPEPPVFSKQGGAQRDIERLADICLNNWNRKVIGKDKPESLYAERFEYEMKLLINAGFCGYFDIVNDYTRAAKGAGKLMGPSRGSGGGSLVAYLSDITEVDPIDTDLLFERFLTPGRKSLPDFDLDFPASGRDWIEDYVAERWGSDHVVRVGTHIRLRNKGVFRDMFRVLKSQIPNLHWPDLEAISKIIDEAESDSAGLGIPWEQLMEDEAERLAPFIEKYPLVFHHASRLAGRLKSYGKHAAGVVISTGESLLDRLPMRQGGKQMVSDFDMEALEAIGLVKFDLLTIRTMDTIQMAVDLIKERHGVSVDIYNWKAEYQDSVVWDQICEGHTLGLFQIETPALTKLTREFGPRTVSDLSDVVTLVRPGPKRSGLTEMFMRRRAGVDPVTVPHPKLEPILSKTYGCIVYQEDVMATCMALAGYDGTEADTVRKILGKKKVEAVLEEGQKFVARCAECGVPPEIADPLWHQMAEFAKYSFNRAHAYAYAMITYWTAWLKFKYPIEFITALLSTVGKDRIPDFINEARRMGIRVLPPDINDSGVGFSAGNGVVRYGLDSVKEVGDAAVEAITRGQPYASFEDFKERKGSNANSRVVAILSAVGAFDSLVPNRAALELHLRREADGELDRCVDWNPETVGPNGLPCMFDWLSEPVQIGKSGRPIKQKPVPKKCTKACRQFRPRDRTMTEVEPYTDVEIREREMEYLGVHLSSTPFDRIPAEMWDTELTTGVGIETGPVGNYKTVGILTKVKPWSTSTGDPMGFVAFRAKDADIDVTVFPAYWKDYERDLKPGTMCLLKVRKEDRRDKPGETGLQLLELLPV